MVRWEIIWTIINILIFLRLLYVTSMGSGRKQLDREGFLGGVFLFLCSVIIFEFSRLRFFLHLSITVGILLIFMLYDYYLESKKKDTNTTTNSDTQTTVNHTKKHAKRKELVSNASITINTKKSTTNKKQKNKKVPEHKKQKKINLRNIDLG